MEVRIERDGLDGLFSFTAHDLTYNKAKALQDLVFAIDEKPDTGVAVPADASIPFLSLNDLETYTKQILKFLAPTVAKIPLIKLVRMLPFGFGLKEAKDLVESQSSTFGQGGLYAPGFDMLWKPAATGIEARGKNGMDYRIVSVHDNEGGKFIVEERFAYLSEVRYAMEVTTLADALETAEAWGKSVLPSR
jgi:hypothetical protein